MKVLIRERRCSSISGFLLFFEDIILQGTSGFSLSEHALKTLFYRVLLSVY